MNREVSYEYVHMHRARENFALLRMEYSAKLWPTEL